MKHIWLALYIFCGFFVAGEMVGEIEIFIRSGFENNPSINVIYRIVGFAILFFVIGRKRNFVDR